MVTPIKGVVPNPTTINGTLLSLPCWRLSLFLVPDSQLLEFSSAHMHKVIAQLCYCS